MPAEGAQTYSNRSTLVSLLHLHCGLAGDGSTQTVTIKTSDSPSTVWQQYYSYRTSEAESFHQTERAGWNQLSDTLNSKGPFPQSHHSCSSCCSWSMLWISPPDDKYCMCSWVHVRVSMCLISAIQALSRWKGWGTDDKVICSVHQGVICDFRLWKHLIKGNF